MGATPPTEFILELSAPNDTHIGSLLMDRQLYINAPTNAFSTMSKGGTAQELFIICQTENKDIVKNTLKDILNQHPEISHTFKDIRDIKRKQEK